MIDAGTLAGAYLLDLLAGDPRSLPHPVRFMGGGARLGEKAARRLVSRPCGELVAGALVAAFVIGASAAAPYGLIQVASHTHPLAGTLVEVVLGWTALATRSLLDEAGAVVAALESRDLPVARQRLSRIVGRDTEGLDHAEISRALIETVAESTCDGILAPLFYLTVGGPSLALAYKAVNTLDSMIGHPEPPYTWFGRFAARADDVANFIPARATALFLVAAAALSCASPVAAWRVWRRDGRKHPSPNAGQSEAAMAGALTVRLGGLNAYGGKPNLKPHLGHEYDPPTVRQARRSLQLALTASLLGFAAALLVVWWCL